MKEFIFILFLLFSLIASENENAKADKLDKEQRLKNEQKAKESACYALLKYYIELDNEGKRILQYIRESGKDPEKLYKSLIDVMVKKCLSEVKQEEAIEMVSSDNFLSIIGKYKRLIKIEPSEVNHPDIDREDLSMVRDIQNAINNDFDGTGEKTYGVFGMDLNKSKKLSMIFAIIGFILFLVIVLGGLYKLNKKNVKDKKKNKKNK